MGKCWSERGAFVGDRDSASSRRPPLGGRTSLTTHISTAGRRAPFDPSNRHSARSVRSGRRSARSHRPRLSPKSSCSLAPADDALRTNSIIVTKKNGTTSRKPHCRAASRFWRREFRKRELNRGATSSALARTLAPISLESVVASRHRPLAPVVARFPPDTAPKSPCSLALADDALRTNSIIVRNKRKTVRVEKNTPCRSALGGTSSIKGS